MTALTTDRKTPYTEGVELALPVGAAKQIFAGSLVCLDGTTRLAEPASDATGKIFAGVAREWADNRLGDAGDLTVLLRRKGLFLFAMASAAQTDVGKPAYVVDDQTVGLAATTTNDVACGVIVAVESSTSVWVEIAPGSAA